MSIATIMTMVLTKMKKNIYRFLKAINWRLNRLVKGFEKTYEEQILDDLSRKNRGESDAVQFYNWQIYSHDIGLIYAGINSQFSMKVNDFYTDKSDPVILDCGANIGMSVLRHKQLYPNAKIIAFEPDPQIFESLKQNVIENNLKDIELVLAAVWITEGELEFSSDNYDGGFISTQQHNNSERHLSNSSVIRVPSIDLRDYLKHSIDFLKMDIEGAEYEVLTHCASLLHNVEKLIIEVHYRVDEVHIMMEILGILENAGFMVSVVSPLEHDAKTIDLRKPFVRNPSANADIYIGLYAWRSN